MGMFSHHVSTVKGSEVKRKKPLYSRITSEPAWEKVTNLYLADGKKPSEIRKIMLPLVAKNFTLESLTVLINRHGLPAARRRVVKRLSKVEDRIVKAKHSKALKEVKESGVQAEAVADRVIARAEQGAEKHFDRMEKLIDKAHRPLDNALVDQDTVGDFLDNTDKFDKIARRTYGMDKHDTLDPHKHSVAVLLNLNTIVEANKEKEASGRVLS